MKICPNITESDDEITLDITENINDMDQLSEFEEPLEDLNDFELPGTEDIDLNSLEALAKPDESNASQQDISEIAEEPIEIDLEDMSSDITDTVSDLIDDVSEDVSDDDEVIDIDLPEEDLPLRGTTLSSGFLPWTNYL